jgi:hypothetical protein
VNYANFIFKTDVAWNMHDLHGPEEGRWKGFEQQMITTRHYPEWPNSLEFPFSEIVQHFKSKYFINSVAYMVAHALWSYKTIGKMQELLIFGADYDYAAAPEPGGFQAKTPYEHGKQCVEYWIGRAMEAGLNVAVAPRSFLMHTCHMVQDNFIPYGYNFSEPIMEGANVLGYKLPEVQDKIMSKIPDDPNQDTSTGPAEPGKLVQSIKEKSDG